MKVLEEMGQMHLPDPPPPDVLDEENLGNLLDTANREQRKLMIRR